MVFEVGTTGSIRPTWIIPSEDNDSELLAYAKAHGDFEGKLGELYYVPSVEGDTKLLVGLGDADDLDEDKLRIAAFKLGNLLAEKRETEVELYAPATDLPEGTTAMALAEGLRLSTYRFDKYLSDKQEVPELTVRYHPTSGDAEAVKPWIDRAETVYEGIKLARDLVNERSNVIYPETLAEAVVTSLEPLGVKVTVYEEDAIREMGMEAFLSVAKGSDRPPRFIVMEYRGDEASDEVTGLVGKGLTYDSGGYSIKSTSGMKTMNADMGGAGTVIGTIYSLAKLDAKVNVIGVVAACENLVSGHAYKPGDIIGSMSGKTIEIDNTDAEGRVTLADAVWYITHERKVDRVVDLATLTGACVSALGDAYTGAITNKQAFFDELLAASKRAGEKIWQMPGHGAFLPKNKSRVADILNSGERGGGMMSAGEFVGFFLDGDIPWVHLDIAGPAYLSKARDYYIEGATGIHVRTLVYLLAGLEA